jgi:hypothetical protein
VVQRLPKSIAFTFQVDTTSTPLSTDKDFSEKKSIYVKPNFSTVKSALAYLIHFAMSLPPSALSTPLQQQQ